MSKEDREQLKMKNFYVCNEWKPDVDDDNWEEFDENFEKYSKKKLKEIEYEIDDDVIEKATERIKLEEKHGVVSNDIDTKNNLIIKIYKIYDNDFCVIGYTTNSLMYVMRKSLVEYLKNNEVSYLFKFNNYKKVKIELLECYKQIGDTISKTTLNKIKTLLKKKHTPEINSYNFYKTTIKSVVKLSLKKDWDTDDDFTTYYIYSVVEKESGKKLIIYSSEKIKGTSDEIQEILSEEYGIDLPEKGKYKIELLEEKDAILNIEAEICCDNYIKKNNTLDEKYGYNDKYYVITEIKDSEKLNDVKKDLHCKIQYCIAKKFNEEKPVTKKDSKLERFGYLIKINDKRYVGVSDNEKVNDLFYKLYIAKDISPAMKKVVKEVRNVYFKDIEFKILFTEINKTRVDIMDTLNGKITKYKANDPKIGLNFIEKDKKPFQSIFQKQLSKKN